VDAVGQFLFQPGVRWVRPAASSLRAWRSRTRLITERANWRFVLRAHRGHVVGGILSALAGQDVGDFLAQQAHQLLIHTRAHPIPEVAGRRSAANCQITGTSERTERTRVERSAETAPRPRGPRRLRIVGDEADDGHPQPGGVQEPLHIGDVAPTGGGRDDGNRQPGPGSEYRAQLAEPHAQVRQLFHRVPDQQQQHLRALQDRQGRRTEADPPAVGDDVTVG